MGALEEHLPYALTQFESEVLIPVRVFGLDLSFTTITSAKLTTALLVGGYLVVAARERSLVPGRLQASAELMYEFVAGVVTKVVGPEAKPSTPFVFVLFGTLFGLTPIKETFTGQLVVTMALAFVVFAHVNAVALRRQGAGRQGAGGGLFPALFAGRHPLFVAPVLLFVEVVSYLFRPVTLGFCLFANVVAGHIMLKLFGDFCAMPVAGLGVVGAAGSLLLLPITVVILAFEIMIVCVQSYVFMSITSMYLRDALRSHRCSDSNKEDLP